MPSTAAAVRLLGGGTMWAQGANALVALASVVATCWLWVRGVSKERRYSALVVTALLATPYAFHYDLTVLVLPLLWLAPWNGRRRGLAALLWLSPVLTLVLARLTSIQLGPVLLLGLLAVCLRDDT
jgi:hypothetical protein